ncbi:MAG: glycosyltransferase [Proteobacteria bacterium]|nr:glycosyltransferase [Pseudomonadota bacterium]
MVNNCSCQINELPKVTIVTPSFNQGHFIEDTLLSIKGQDYPHIEHIIIDGGSTDNSLEVIKEYENTYNMRWISEPDNGQADAINKGFNIVDGQICGWLNSDDVYFSSSTISYVVQKFMSHKSASVIFGDDILIDRNKQFLFKRTMGEFDYKKMLIANRISQPATFFLKEVIVNHLLDEKFNYAMDYEYWLRLYNKGYKFKYVDKILACNRIHCQRKMLVGKIEADKEVRVIQSNFSNLNESSYGIIKKLVDKLFYYGNRIKGIRSLVQLNYEEDKITGMLPNRLHNLILEQVFMKSYKEIVKSDYP